MKMKGGFILVYLKQECKKGVHMARFIILIPKPCIVLLTTPKNLTLGFGRGL
jgi:hypothetical protein